MICHNLTFAYKMKSMKPLTPIVQRPQDLILALVTDDSLPASQILAERIVQKDDWRIRFAIIGESHRVKVEHQGRFIMEEMLACTDISTQTCRHHHQFSDLQAHHHQGKNYSVAIEMCAQADLWNKQSDELVFNFPKINGIEPVTKLQWQVLETSIQWRSLHTYIHAGALLCIYSQSKFALQAEE